jgi:phosphoenolpyruvate carboxykinase (ATP)
LSVFEQPIEAREILVNPPSEQLREMARKDEIPNVLGMAVYRAQMVSRSAQFTEIVYEPSEEVVREITEVRQSLKDKRLICVERNIGTSSLVFRSRYYVTDGYARLALMMTENFYPPQGERLTDITVVCVPEWKRTKVYVHPESATTYILGSDYYGESKMSLLRMAMHLMRERHNGLGVHAGSKIYRVLSHGQLRELGVLIFGLSGTGKTTIICQDHDFRRPEGVEIMQDDINMVTMDASAYGTERKFYIKTDSLSLQPDLLRAATRPDAIAENVFVSEHGELDYDDQSVSTNGRCIIERMHLPRATDSIDLQRIDVILFLTRRYDTRTVGRLRSAAQAAAYLTLGESTITSADDPARAGESKRVVAFDPFIIDQKHKNGNRFYEILQRNPHIKCYILNTGKVGGMDRGIKIKPEITFKIVEEIMRGRIRWAYDQVIGYDIALSVKGVNLELFDPYKIYGTEKFVELMKNLRRERIEFLSQFPDLDREIVNSIGRAER